MSRKLPDEVMRMPSQFTHSIKVLPKFLFAVTRNTLSILWGVLGFLTGQMYGLLRNIGSLLSNISVTDVLPRTFARYYKDGQADARDRGPAAVGWDTPKKQITTGVLLGLFFFATSLVSGGVTLALIVGVAVPVAFFGVLRLIPVINSNWKKTRRGVEKGGKKVYNVRKRGGRK